MKFWNKLNSKINRYALLSGFVMFLVIPGMVRCAGSVDAQAEVTSDTSALQVK